LTKLLFVAADTCQNVYHKKLLNIISKFLVTVIQSVYSHSMTVCHGILNIIFVAEFNDTKKVFLLTTIL